MPKSSVLSHSKLARLWRFGPLAFGAFLFAALVLVVLKVGDLQQISVLVRHARPEMLVPAILAQGLTYACSAAVWRQFLRHAGYRRSLRTLVPLGVAKLFADQTMPPNGVSGALLVLHSLVKRGVPSRIGATAMLLALFAFYAAFLIVVLASLGLLWLHHRSRPSLTLVVFAFGVIAIGVPTLILLARRYGAGRLREWSKRIPGVATILDKLVDAPVGLLRDPRLIAEAIGLHIGIFVLDAATLWLVLGALGVAPAFWVAFVSYVIANVVATVAMVPMGLGTFEAGCAGMLTFLGVPLAAAFAATLLLRGLTFWLPMAPGLWIARREMVGRAGGLAPWLRNRLADFRRRRLRSRAITPDAPNTDASRSAQLDQEAVRAYWNKSAEAVLAGLAASPAGLQNDQAVARLERDGPNALEDRSRANAIRLLLRQFESPLVLILVFGSLVAFALQDWTEASIILAIVLGSTILGFAQEYHATRAIEALRARLALSSRVIRGGVERAIPAAEIVAGDIIVLSAGNLIPADGLIIEARDFLVTEASLTGESFPVEKAPGILPIETALAERKNCVFAGASVRSGQAKVVIVETGQRTLFGAVAARLREREPETEFARGLRRFGYLLLRVMIVLVIFVLTINQLLGRPFLESLLFSVALAVGLSPELLPAIVSVTLSAGARRMAQRGVLVRRLEAIENLGGVDVLCTDKTGTLTEGAVALKEALDSEGKPSPTIMQLAFLNAALETGIENPLDQAIVMAGKEQKLVTQGWRKADEIPYDFQRKRLTIVVDDGQAESRLIITKGAFNEMMSVCTLLTREGAPTPLDGAARAALEARYRDYGLAGQRALALATRRTPVQDDFTREDERDMEFAGFLVFLDPPKPDARATLAALASAGVKVKIITGDNRYVASYVAGAMGLNGTALLRGEDLEAIKGDALLPIVERTDIFAEIDPQQKERIVKALQKNGHAVAFLGDGVNDAPALHAADVGISVDGAVDVAREAADVILLQRDLGVLKQGIEDGRRTFANTMKYICINTGSCFGNMVSMALATPLLPFLPLTATQVLLTNFLTDLPLMAITTDGVDPERVSQPQRLRIHDVQIFMIVFGLLSSVFDLMTFLMLSVVFHANAATFQTTWFVVSVLTELLALFVLRTQRPVWKSNPGRWIVWLSAVVAGLAIAAPLVAPIADVLGLKVPPPAMIAAALAIVLVYAATTEAVKAMFYRRAARADAKSWR